MKDNNERLNKKAEVLFKSSYINAVMCSTGDTV